MKRIVITAIFPLLAIACATGMGKKMSQSTIDEIQAGKGKLTRDEVRQKIGAAPQTQMQQGNMICDTYSYSGVVNYFLFTTPDKSQSYAFCYDTAGVLKEVSGLQL